MMLIIQKTLNLKCLFHGKVMRVYKITVLSFKEVCKFLLQQGISYILPERFCQVDLENYLGKQHAIGRRYDNPTVHEFEYKGNTVKNQFLVRPIGGNVQGPSGKFNEICNGPLPQRKKNEMSLKKFIVVLAVGQARAY